MFRALILLLGTAAAGLNLGACSDPDSPSTQDLEPRDGVIALVDAVLIDGTGAAPRPHTTIVVSDGIIVRVGPVSEVDVPADAVTINTDGQTVLPGFINAHVHANFAAGTLRDFAADGVTTLRDIGYFGTESYATVFRNRDALNADAKHARVVAAGPLVTTIGGYGGYEVASPDDAATRVAELIDDGADLIKIAIEDNLQGRAWPMLSQAEIDTIVATAHRKGLRVSAHVSRSIHARMAVAAGVDDLAHMTIDRITPDLVAQLVNEGVCWVPTLELWRGVSNRYGLNWDDIAIDNLRQFHEAGGRVALGTDFGGYTTPFDRGMPMTEIRLMEAAGMTPMQIIVAGTRNAAYVCGLEEDTGTVVEGKAADIIVVPANPLDDLEALKDVRLVIRRGAIILDSF